MIHHIGYDERRGIAARGQRMPSPLDQLREVVEAVSVPVQAVGGLTLEQAVRTPEYGAPLVVLGAPLTIDADAFKTAGGDLEGSLRLICEKVHGYGDVPVGKKNMKQAGGRQLRAGKIQRRAARDRAARRSAPTTCCCEVAAVGVCGSDLHQWTAEHSWPVNYPVVLGHEFAGIGGRSWQARRTAGAKATAA